MNCLLTRSNDTTLTTCQIVLRITIVIVVVEALIMFFLATSLHEMSPIVEAILDAALLALLSTPFIYLWIIRPFVDARDAAVNRMTHLAFHDSLTELPNRRFFTEIMEKNLSMCSRYHKFGALLLIDLNRFKAVNDQYGHLAGDYVLREVAKRLQDVSRSDDMVCRLGGDEFVIILQPLEAQLNQSVSRAQNTQQRILEVLENTISFEHHILQIGASVGIRTFGTGDSSVDEVIRDADRDMYSSKEETIERLETVKNKSVICL